MRSLFVPEPNSSEDRLWRTVIASGPKLLGIAAPIEPDGQEVIARAGNYEVCKAAFDKALFLYPTEHLELRQGARVIYKSKEG